MADLRQGRIVWVELLDPQGRNPKVRPAVVLTSTAEIAATGTIRVAAGTSDVGSVPADEGVTLPWLATGHPTTKLTRPSVAVVTWIADVPASAVRVAGTVPLKPFLELTAKVASRNAPPPVAPSPPPPP